MENENIVKGDYLNYIKIGAELENNWTKFLIYK